MVTWVLLSYRMHDWLLLPELIELLRAELLKPDSEEALKHKLPLSPPMARLMLLWPTPTHSTVLSATLAVLLVSVAN